jgi:tRNA(Ile)-lysidine synthase
MPVRGAGTYHFNGQSFMVEVLDRTPDMPMKQPDGVLIMDADKLRFPFVLRRWRSGDWLVPFGMRGKKKVSDLFTDLKYDALQKSAAVMIVDTRSEGMAESQHVSAVVGVRIDDRYKVSSSTRKIIRIAGA